LRRRATALSSGSFTGAAFAAPEDLIQPDRDNGYECDGNNEIGKAHPDHTLCDP